MTTQKRLLFALLFLVVVIIVGVSGFRAVDRNYSFLDSLYMTIITIFGVGYRELFVPPNAAAKIFTVGIIIVGVGIIAFTTAVLTAFILEGQLAQIFRRQKMQKEIDKMENHYIVCGAGATARYVVEELHSTRNPFVLVDTSEENAERMHDVCEFPYVIGDATHDAVLQKAGIERARGIVSVLPEDRDNLFVVITARGLNKKIRIVAKAVEEETKNKLYKVGANSVVSPTAIGGMRIASEMIRPAVVSFLDTMLRDKEMTLRVEEAVIGPDSSFIGKTIAEVDIGRKTGAIIVAIADGETGKQKFNPPADTQLKANDVLIMIGSIEQVTKLRLLASKTGLSVTTAATTEDQKSED
jgi:voltage-gated potassium channel